MNPSASLLGNHKDESIASLLFKELIEKADGSSGVFSGGVFPIYLHSLHRIVFTFFSFCNWG